MEPFTYYNDELYAEDVAVARIAEQMGTPFYVYSRAAIESQWKAYDEAFSGRNHLVCYAVKANPNLAILGLLARLGSGFDIVSAGELERVLRAGGEADRVVFSGVGKTADEIRTVLNAKIHCFDVESGQELERINRIAGELGTTAPVSLRVNPDVDPDTHPYIATGLKESKFGIPINIAADIYRHANSLPNISLHGIACHIGSQLTTIDPFLDSLERILDLVGQLDDEGITLNELDLGGGLGVTYFDEEPPEPDDLVVALMDRLQTFGSRYQKMKFIVEPGRSIVANAGMLVTCVQYLKHSEVRNFAVVDAGMNDLMRPSLYDAWHPIVPVSRVQRVEPAIYDVVGPVCESGDFLGQERELAIEQDDLIAVLAAGAYGASMGSNYNSRLRPPEVLVDGNEFHIIRRRESIEDMLSAESPVP